MAIHSFHSRLCTTTSYAFITLWSLFFIHVCKIFITNQSEYESFLILPYLEPPMLLVEAGFICTLILPLHKSRGVQVGQAFRRITKILLDVCPPPQATLE